MSDIVVLVELVHAPPAPTTGESLEKSHFKVTQVIKGDSHVKQGELIKLLYFAEGEVGDTFLMLGVDPPKTSWVTPTHLDSRALAYVKKIITLPKEGPDRLDFFETYLEDDNELLARDAYDEFARASYAAVTAMKDQMNHDQLVAWIRNPEIPASRRRLYFTMLGVCGNDADADLLEGMLRSDDRKQRSGLDAMIACFLRLRKAEGLPLIEELFLKNTESEYADTYSAIMALRFHGQETDVIPREKILKSMHSMLDRPELADLVIVDLARWEDWSVMDRLVKLFKDADEKSSWVRVPVVRYLLVCPKPEAKTHLAELEKIDAGAVRRAKTFFPVGGGDETSLLDPTLMAPNEVPYGYASNIPVNATSATLPTEPAEVAAQASPAKSTLPANSFDYATVAIIGTALAVAGLYGLVAWRSGPPMNQTIG